MKQMLQNLVYGSTSRDQTLNPFEMLCRNYNRRNRIPPILLKISVLVEGTGSYSEKKSVRSTLPKLGDTAVWNFAKCPPFRWSGQVTTGHDESRQVTTQIKTKKPSKLPLGQYNSMRLSRSSFVFILGTVLLIHIALMYFEKKMMFDNIYRWESNNCWLQRYF